MLDLILNARYRLWWRWLCGLLTVVVLYLALTPQPPQSLDTGWDKANHLLAFSTLTACAWLGWTAGARQRTRAAAGVIAAQFALGVLIELLQTQVSGRSADVEDLLADALGIALGAVFAWRLTRTAGRSARR